MYFKGYLIKILLGVFIALIARTCYPTDKNPPKVNMGLDSIKKNDTTKIKRK